MKKVIIFDLDGTLVDTLLDLTNSVNFALTTYGYEKQKISYVRSAIGDGVETLIKRCIPDGIDNPKYLDVLSTFKSHYKEHFLTLSSPYEDVKETLLSLKGYGYKLAVATNKDDELAYRMIDKFFYGIFDSIVGSRPTRRKKPHPETINIALKQLKVTNLNQVIYVGDTEVDYLLAIHANIEPLLVSYGYRNESFLRDKCPDVKVITNFKSILNYFGNLKLN